jgi:hypothetical protein
MPPQALVERWFARMYRWPPEVTARLTLEQLAWFPILEAADQEAERLRNPPPGDKPQRRGRL